jgi:Tol biopolymer transport system component
VMNADGSGQTNLTNNAAWDYGPAWSPDGSKIAFTSSRDGDSEIYVMNPDGSDQTNLTNNAARDEEPAWSPDGSKIAFASDRDGNYEVYVMNADGSSQTNLTNNAATDNAPDWQPLYAGPVGGIAELPEVSDSSGRNYVALAGLAAAGFIALSAGAWYARRRWVR